MFDPPKDSILFAEDNRGIYIPQHFAESIDRATVSGVSQDDWDCLEAGPPDSVFAEHDGCEHYWDVWDYVEQNATVTRPSDGMKFHLYQDGDLWLVPTKDEGEAA